jgi:hypothetical protein
MYGGYEEGQELNARPSLMPLDGKPFQLDA